METFFPTFHIWQIFSLSPFALAKTSLQPKTNRFHSYLSLLSTIIQFSILIYGFWDYQFYTNSSDQSTSIFVAGGDIFLMALIRCTSITIVIESWLKRSHQIDFLTQIDQIDRIMHTKLLIDLQYKLEQKRHFRNLTQWIGGQVSLVLSMMLLTSLTQMVVLKIYWAFYTFPLFLCMMRYQQFISYVNLLYIRFRALNECIERLKSSKFHSSIDSNCTQDLRFIAHFTHFQNEINAKNMETFLIVNQLKHFQRTRRLLIEANQMLCKLFNWSMLLNVGNDFFNLIMNMYWLMINFLHGDSKLELIGMFAWVTFNSFMLSSLTKACQIASDEVI